MDEKNKVTQHLNNEARKAKQLLLFGFELEPREPETKTPTVRLLDYTGAGTPDPERYAAELLLFTKNTRLEMRSDLQSEISQLSYSELLNELEYIANTIPSSWEFVNYTFLINDVTRAFTHQFVRTRTGSYAQQTMRVLNVNGWEYATGPTVLQAESEVSKNYHGTMKLIAEAYDELVSDGVAIEDARGILPTNILTNIVAKFDLRTLADTMRKRASTRTQGEYRVVLELMKDAVIVVHPWAKMFFDRTFDQAAADLERMIIAAGSRNNTDKESTTKMIKLLDQMRATA